MPLLYEQKEFKERDESLASLSVQSFEYIYYRTRVRSLAMLVTHSLTDCRLVNLIDVTLVCEDGNSQLEVMKLNLGRDSGARFGQDFEF